MVIYELSTDDLDATELVFPIEKERMQFLQLAEDKISNGISVKDEWDDFLVLKKEPKIDMDFYDIEDSGCTILNQKAYSLISPLLDESIEVLKLRSDEGELYLLNIIYPTRCFNKKDAEYTALENEGIDLIMDYKRLSFYPDKIKCPIFRIPELPYATLLTDKIMQIYHQNSLRGLNLTDNEYIWNRY